MSETGKQERVDILGAIRPRNNPPNKDVLLWVTPSRGQIQYDPDINQTRGHLVGVELDAVNREHKDDVVFFDAAISKCLYHIYAMEHV